MEASELEQAYIYFKHLLKTAAEGRSITGSYRTDSIRYHLLGFLIDYHGFNGFPVAIKDGDFKKLPETSYYHGFGHGEHGKQFLDSFSYHYGTGKHLDGFYLTDIQTEAFKYVQDRLMEANESLYYSDISHKTQKGLTAEFKMLGTKGVKEKQLDEIIKLFNSFKESTIKDEQTRQKLLELRGFIQAHSGEAGISLFVDYLTQLNKPALAVYLGYDYVQDDVGYIVMFNRSKLAVKQSDYDRFVSSGKGEESPEGGGLQ